MVLSNKRITKALIRLRGRAGWSGPLLFANPRSHVFLQLGPNIHESTKFKKKYELKRFKACRIKNYGKIREATIICLIQYFEAGFLWNVSLKILNSGIILKTPTYA